MNQNISIVHSKTFQLVASIFLFLLGLAIVNFISFFNGINLVLAIVVSVALISIGAGLFAKYLTG
ncbi:MAG: hypothetical protein Q7S21_00470 [archaeon]|nr:hypothetical protein [archaeon]